VLIVDDEANQRSAVARMVERWGFVAETAADGQEALDKLPLFEPHAIVTDVMMPGMDGMELLRRLNEIAGAPPVIVLTAFGSIDAALTTVHERGAFWFVEKPIRPRTFRILLDRAVAHHRLWEDKERLERQLSGRGVLGKLIGSSPAMQELFFLLRQAAPSNANILITGESGTGTDDAVEALDFFADDSDLLCRFGRVLPDHGVEQGQASRDRVEGILDLMRNSAGQSIDGIETREQSHCRWAPRSR
jgi:DNA-binding NtrC family response regulator